MKNEKDSVKMGANKTGAQMSPIHSKEMMTGIDDIAGPSSELGLTPVEFERSYIQGSGPIGTVPLPGTVKGAATTAATKVMGRHPEILIDKLGERLAFERSGVRLYDALIAKCEALDPTLDLSVLREFRDEELEHFECVQAAMEKIGADPTAQTPCADVSGVASMGLVQVINDPRVSIQGSVEALLIAELADNDAWEILIKLAEKAGLDEQVQDFTVARQEEAKHLSHIRAWLEEMVVRNETVPVQ